MAIRLLPGTSATPRRAAADLRTASAKIDGARPAAVALQELAGGQYWQGEAFEACRAAFERAPLPPAIDNAMACMADAAGALDAFAAAHDRNQSTLRWCRHRVAAVEAAMTADPEAAPSLQSELAHLRAEADRAWQDHRAALELLRETFDRLDDAPFFATPPPSTFDRVTDWGASFIGGIGAGTWELVQGVATLAELSMPWRWPANAMAIWNSRDQIIGIVHAFVDDPLGFTIAFGKALLDWDLLRSDFPRWLGKQVPQLLLDLATGGIMRTGTMAARGARVGRGFGVTTRLARHVDLADTRFLRAFDDPVDALGVVAEIASGPRRLPARLADQGSDARLLARVADGPFTRTDTTIGRVLLDHDDAVGGLRQIPGRAADELRGLSDLTLDVAGLGPASSGLAPRIISHPVVHDQVVRGLTGGWSTRLGLLDNVLVGQGVLSPQALGVQAAGLGIEAAGWAVDQRARVEALQTAAADG